METWISDIEGLFTDGVTAIDFSANQWAVLSSKNTLKTDLAQHIVAMAGLPVRMDVNGHPTTMLGALLAGEDPIKLNYGLVDGPRTLYGSSILTLHVWRRMPDQWIGRMIRPREITKCIAEKSALFPLPRLLAIPILS